MLPLQTPQTGKVGVRIAVFECQRFRIELWQCRDGKLHVSIQPLEYLGKEEFKRWIRLCKRNFMSLISRKPWHFEIAFSNRVNAVGFAKNMARQLGEVAFFDHTKGHVEVVTPKEA
ncbi:MAG: hypothetical protein QMD10_10140 [Desulfitobacteriaceae bacterium]|nr:hypothetical protein [Desulfitobacteriaceae bacterium]